MYDDEYERIWKEVVVAKSRRYPGTFLGGLRKAITNLSEDSRCLGKFRTKHLQDTG
jgi:hypothetical protein